MSAPSLLRLAAFPRPSALASSSRVPLSARHAGTRSATRAPRSPSSVCSRRAYSQQQQTPPDPKLNPSHSTSSGERDRATVGVCFLVQLIPGHFRSPSFVTGIHAQGRRALRPHRRRPLPLLPQREGKAYRATPYVLPLPRPVPPPHSVQARSARTKPSAAPRSAGPSPSPRTRASPSPTRTCSENGPSSTSASPTAPTSAPKSSTR